MSITSYKTPYAVVVQQTPKQFHAEGNVGFPNKFVYSYFDDYEEAYTFFKYMLGNVHDLIVEFTEGIISIYSYSSTQGDSSYTSWWFYEDGTLENHSIETATTYQLY